MPIYFWGSREGGNTAARCDDRRPFKVLAMFARRPKILAPGQPSILMKINGALFEQAAICHGDGVPVLAGIPMVSSLMDFGMGARCGWFSIEGRPSGAFDEHLSIDLAGGLAVDRPSSGIRGPLTDHELLSIAQAHTAEKSWSDFVHLANQLRAQAGGPPIFGGTYKPVYLLLRR